MSRALRRRLERAAVALKVDTRRRFFVWGDFYDSEETIEAKVQEAMTRHRCTREQIATVRWRFSDGGAGDEWITVHER